MSDPTEGFRREMVSELNRNPGGRDALEVSYGTVWNTEQMQEEFVALGFLAPYIHVMRKVDRVKGTLMFQHNPRFYFSFCPE